MNASDRDVEDTNLFNFNIYMCVVSNSWATPPVVFYRNNLACSIRLQTPSWAVLIHVLSTKLSYVALLQTTNGDYLYIYVSCYPHIVAYG